MAVATTKRGLERAIGSARAEIAWGYDPSAVRGKLIDAGVHHHVADDVIETAVAARNAEYRQKGLTDMVVGAVTLAGVLLWLYFLLAADGPNKRAGGIIAGIGLGAAFWMIRGLVRAIHGGEGERSSPD